MADKLKVSDRPAPQLPPGDTAAMAPATITPAAPVDLTVETSVSGASLQRMTDLAMRRLDQRHGLASPGNGAPPTAQKISPAIARVGHVSISMAQALAVADTHALKRELSKIVDSYAQAKHLTRATDESPDNFYRRLCNVGIADGSLTVFADQLADCVDRAALRAAMDLIDNANLLHNLPPEDVADIDPRMPVVDQNAILRRRALIHFAHKSHVEPDSAAAAKVLDQWILKTQEHALWVPYHAALDQAFAEFKPKDRAAIRDRLLALYVDAYGLDAARRIALELTERGPAAQLAAVIRATHTLTWTVGGLVAAAEKHSDIAPVVHNLLRSAGIKQEEAVQYASTPLELLVRPTGLFCIAPKKTSSDVFAAMHAGKAHVLWNKPPGEAPQLVITADPGVTLDATQVAAAHDEIINNHLRGLGDTWKRTWTEGAPTFGQFLQATRLGRYAGDGLSALILDMPGMHEQMRSSATADVLAGKSPEEIAAKCAKLQLPKVEADKLVAVAKNIGALRAIYPPPRVFMDLVTGISLHPIELPFSVDAPLSSDQRQFVAMLQTYLVAKGLLKQSPNTLGELNEETIKQLKGYTSDKATSFKLDAELAARLIGSIAENLRASPLFVGDWASQNPAFIAYRAAGGTSDPMRFGLAYLDALGFPVLARPLRAGPALFDAIAATSALPLDDKALAKATATAANLPTPSEAELADFFSAKFTVVPTRPARTIALAAATDQERKDLRGRIDARGEASAVRSVDRVDLGDLSWKEPIVALKLAVSELYGRHVNINGPFDGTMDSGTLRALRNMRFKEIREAAGSDTEVPADAPALYRQLTNVADAIDRGDPDALIVNLTDKLRPTPVGNDANAVVAALAQMAAGLRAGTLPASAAQVAIGRQLAEFEPIWKKRRKLEAARVVLGGAPSAGVAHLRDDDIVRAQNLLAEARGLLTSDKLDIATAAKSFVTKWDALAPSMKHVRHALDTGGLSIVEQQVQCADPDLAARGQELLDALIAAAELKQAQGRAANRNLGGILERGASSALAHFSMAPGGADSELLNSADGWMLAALKVEMAQHGGPDISQPWLQPGLLRNEGGKPVLVPEPPVDADSAVAAARKKSAEVAKSVMKVDAATLQYLVDHHADLIADAWVDALTSGEPGKLGEHRDALVFLAGPEGIIAKMKSGAMKPLDNLDITAVDTDPEIRKLKALVQNALVRLQQPGAQYGRNVAALGATAARMLGADKQNVQLTLRALLVQQGYLNVQQVGALADPVLSATVLEKAVHLALVTADAREKSSDLVGAKILREAAARLYTLVQEGHGATVSNDGSPDATERALRAILRYGSNGLEAERMLTDFGTVLPSELDKLEIRSPLHNGMGRKPAASFTDSAKNLGRAAAWTEVEKTNLASWWDRSHFSLVDAAETYASSWGMFGIMPFMIAYDTGFAPVKKFSDGVRQWFDANTDDESDAAKDKMWAAGSGLVDTYASFIPFIIGYGFLPSVKHDWEEGRIGPAVGVGILSARMMLHSALGAIQMGRHAMNSAHEFMHRGKPQVVMGSRTVRIDMMRHPVESQRLRTVAGEAYNIAGRVKDFVVDPDLVLKPAGAVLGKARSLASHALKLDTVKVRPLKDTDAFTLELTQEQLEFIHDDLQHGGWGILKLDIGEARLNAKKATLELHWEKLGTSIEHKTQEKAFKPEELRELADALHENRGMVPKRLAKKLGLAIEPNETLLDIRPADLREVASAIEHSKIEAIPAGLAERTGLVVSHTKTLEIRTANLQRLAKSIDVGGGEIDPQLAKDCGLTGYDAGRTAQALHSQIEHLAAMPQVIPPPDIYDLKRNKLGMTELPGTHGAVNGTDPLHIDNATLAELVELQNAGKVKEFTAVLQKEGWLDEHFHIDIDGFPLPDATLTPTSSAAERMRFRRQNGVARLLEQYRRRPPTFAELSKKGMNTFFVTAEGEATHLTLDNSTVTDLIEAHATGNEAGFIRIAKQAKITDLDTARAIADYYRNEATSVGQVKSANRRAGGADIGARFKQGLRDPAMRLEDLAERVAHKVKRAGAAVGEVMAPVPEITDKHWTNQEAAEGVRELFHVADGDLHVVQARDGSLKVRAGETVIFDQEHGIETHYGRQVIDALMKKRGGVINAQWQRIKKTVKGMTHTPSARDVVDLKNIRFANLAQVEAALAGPEGDAARQAIRARAETDADFKAELAKHPALEDYVHESTPATRGALAKELGGGVLMQAVGVASMLLTTKLLNAMGIHDSLVQLGSGMVMGNVSTVAVNELVRLAKTQAGAVVGAVEGTLSQRVWRGVAGGMSHLGHGYIAGAVAENLFMRAAKRAGWAMDSKKVTIGAPATAALAPWLGGIAAEQILQRTGLRTAGRWVLVRAAEREGAQWVLVRGSAALGAKIFRASEPVGWLTLGAEVFGMIANRFDNDYEAYEKELAVSVRKQILDEFSAVGGLSYVTSRPLWLMDKAEDLLMPEFRKVAMGAVHFELAHAESGRRAIDVDDALSSLLGSTLVAHALPAASAEAHDAAYYTRVDPASIDVDAFMKDLDALKSAKPKPKEASYLSLLGEESLLSDAKAHPSTVHFARLIDKTGAVQDRDGLVKQVLASKWPVGNNAVAPLAEVIVRERRRLRVQEIVSVMLQTQDQQGDDAMKALASITDVDRSTGLFAEAEAIVAKLAPIGADLDASRKKLKAAADQAEERLAIAARIAGVDLLMFNADPQQQRELGRERQQLVDQLVRMLGSETELLAEIERGKHLNEALVALNDLHESPSASLSKHLKEIGVENPEQATPADVLLALVNHETPALVALENEVMQQTKRYTDAANGDPVKPEGTVTLASADTVDKAWANAQAERLFKAMDGVGANASDIRAVLAAPVTQAQVMAIEREFNQHYSQQWAGSLRRAVMAELEGEDSMWVFRVLDWAHAGARADDVLRDEKSRYPSSGLKGAFDLTRMNAVH